MISLSKTKQRVNFKTWQLIKETSPLEENISFENHCVNWENSLLLQKEVEVKVLTETLKNEKYCDSLSSKPNEKEKKLSKLNVKNFVKQMKWEKTFIKNKTLKKQNEEKQIQLIQHVENQKELEKSIKWMFDEK